LDLPGCNASQGLAVQRAFTDSLTLIHGPPGSGKVAGALHLIEL
jgi:hypothetical protein